MNVSPVVAGKIEEKLCANYLTPDILNALSTLKSGDLIPQHTVREYIHWVQKNVMVWVRR